MNIQTVRLLFAVPLMCCAGCTETSVQEKTAEEKAIAAIVASEGIFISDYSVLYLGNTPVTDAGLEYLKGLTGLKTLFVGSAKVMDKKTEHLEWIAMLMQLCISDAPLRNSGLNHLKHFSMLNEFHLPITKITEEGFQKLKAALPNCSIVRNAR